MGTALKTFWREIGALGVAGQSAHEQRRIVVLNRARLIGIVVSGGYIALYLALGSREAALINALFILLYASAMLANHRHHHKLARHVA